MWYMVYMYVYVSSSNYEHIRLMPVNVIIHFLQRKRQHWIRQLHAHLLNRHPYYRTNLNKHCQFALLLGLPAILITKKPWQSYIIARSPASTHWLPSHDETLRQAL